MSALNGCPVEWCGYEGEHTHSGGTKYPLLTWAQRKVVQSQFIEALWRRTNPDWPPPPTWHTAVAADPADTTRKDKS